jgi:hypothetical protein
VAAAAAACGTARASLLPPSWKQIKTGPAGGTVWEGELPGASWGHSFTHSYVYLPPNVSTGKRYPVLCVLHGFYGSPSSIVYGIALGDTADRLIQQGRVRPFIMVAPSGNASTLYGGEWTGPRESFVVDSVVPWTDAHLPTIAQRSGRVIAGLSAGAYGAVDIALRHPQLFATAESWSGYFKPIADGTLHGASRAELAAHDRRTSPAATRRSCDGSGRASSSRAGRRTTGSPRRSRARSPGSCRSCASDTGCSCSRAGTTGGSGARSCPPHSSTRSAQALETDPADDDPGYVDQGLSGSSSAGSSSGDGSSSSPGGSGSSLMRPI